MWHQIFEDDTDELAFNELIDTLFKVENEMKWFTTEVKSTTDARWTKSMGELVLVKECEWPTKGDFFVWEALTEIKALPMRGS